VVSNIGWIGLGLIGTPMVRRVLAAGHPVTALARGQGLAEVQAAGAATCSDSIALAASSDILVVCVFTDAQVREALLASGALGAMRAGSIVVIHTTGSPALARALGASAPAGVEVLDATFSGGPGEIAAGTLTIMAGGSEAAFRQASLLFAAYARHVHHVGPLGHGQTIKLLNNLLFATNLRNAAEALRIAERHGFAASTVAQIVQQCSGASFAMERLTSPRPLNVMLAGVRPYIEKDVAAAAKSATEAGMDFAVFEPTVEYFTSPR
jgi:3-hydroxyisobutyrate dehydrogenase